MMDNLGNEIINVYKHRFACKSFDKTKKIPEDTFETILETARLSPSSFGLEAWKFLVVQNEELRNKIREISWGAQSHLPSASHFVIALSRTSKHLNPMGDYIKQEVMIKTQQLDSEMVETRSQKISDYQVKDLGATTSTSLEDWGTHQVYIPIGNMMTTASVLGVDSCAIEGFNRVTMTELLRKHNLLGNDDFKPVCMIAFGYREADPVRPKTRRPKTDVIEWVR